MTRFAEEIIRVLSPVIGKGLATSAVDMQCRKMGILPEDLSEENIGEFSEHFKKIMRIFAGEQIADEIATKMRMVVNDQD
jgi:hypothetical protein